MSRQGEQDGHLKNKYYKAEIIMRFMTKKQQKEFQNNYENAKARNLGSAVAYQLQNTENKFVKVGGDK